MKMLTIKDLSRNEELDRKAMAEVRGGEVLCQAQYKPGMTLAAAIEQFVQFGKCAYEVFSPQYV